MRLRAKIILASSLMLMFAAAVYLPLLEDASDIETATAGKCPTGCESIVLIYT
jgi:hypothetical protein